jgi:hypothetical protein
VKALLALVGLSALIDITPAAYGEPAAASDDVGFLATVRDAGITYTSPDRAIAFGKQVCGWIGSGKPGPEVVQNLQTNNPGMTADHAQLFVAISAKYYCPQQLGNTPRATPQ